MPTPDRLIAIAKAAIAALPPDSRAWRRGMERAVTTAHTAAWLAGTGDRLGVTPGGALLSEKRLSRAERAEIRAAVDAQLRYLAGFDPQAMSEAQARARAAMYAGAVKATYYAARWGAWDIPDALMPGMQACLGNCLCAITGISDNGDGTGVLTRAMGGTEQHCSECPPLAGDHPVKRRGAA